MQQYNGLETAEKMYNLPVTLSAGRCSFHEYIVAWKH